MLYIISYIILLMDQIIYLPYFHLHSIYSQTHLFVSFYLSQNSINFCLHIMNEFSMNNQAMFEGLIFILWCKLVLKKRGKLNKLVNGVMRLIWLVFICMYVLKSLLKLVLIWEEILAACLLIYLEIREC